MSKLVFSPIILTILDGWGYRAETHGNAIAQARKPTYDALLRDYPNTLLRASEHFVGLPDGQMGNSEVGHLNLGAGRIVRMDMTRIDTAIMPTAASSPIPTLLREPCSCAQQKGRALHLIGLLIRWRRPLSPAPSLRVAASSQSSRELPRTSSSTRSWMAATPCRTQRLRLS